MSKTRIAGVQAAGLTPIWAIQLDDVTETITSETTTFPLSVLQAGQKLDCYMDFGGFNLDRTATTRQRQRMCQKVAEEIVTGHTIAGSATIVHDRQQAETEAINLAYEALPEGGEVVIAIAHGWEQADDPTVATVVDLWVVTVSQVDHLIPASADEDLMARATLSGSAYAANVALAA